MFTGIIEEVGRVRSVHDLGTNREFIVEADMARELRIDQSVAHNGVCLTVVEVFTDTGHGPATAYRVVVVKETLERSNLGALRSGDQVNLERSLRIGDRLDGHLVQGHVDTTVRCMAIADLDGSWHYTFELPGRHRLLVHKGSVCINGVGLTVAALDDHSFGVAIIPYTHANTTFRTLLPGQAVNIEFDVLGKYVERMLAGLPGGH